MFTTELKTFYHLVLAIIILAGCADTQRNRNAAGPADTGVVPERRDAGRPSAPAGTFVSPGTDRTFEIGEQVEIEFRLDADTLGVREFRFIVDGNDAGYSGTIPGTIEWNTAGYPAGTRQLRLAVEFEDGGSAVYQHRVVLRSDIAPARYSYRILNSFPHDIRAFTQGLVFHDGFLYESTGQYGQSTLRKTVLETGEVLRSINLDRELFGEGLCVHDGRLYQLTWKSQVGFVYDIETFRVLSRFHYQTEGWGLTSDGIHLIKSDGSHNLYLMEPGYFAEAGRVEVYDNNGPLEGINELEYIDGIIYANLFGTDEIAMIELESGRVTGIIDLTGILDRRFHHPNLDVLNGIAYDHDNGRLFVTGKNWPRLFEIELVRR